MRVVEVERPGVALVFFATSKAHDVALRRLAHERGRRLIEHGEDMPEIRDWASPF